MTEKLILITLMHENTPYFLIFPFFEIFRGAFAPLAPLWRRPWSLLHSIIGAFGSIVGKIFGLGLCSSCRFSASLFGIMLHPFLPLQVTYCRALPHSPGYLFSIYFICLINCLNLQWVLLTVASANAILLF